MTKIRSDSKLAPHEDFIFERLIDRNQGYTTVADALEKEEGVSTSVGALSTYFGKHAWRWRAERAAKQASAIETALETADFDQAKAKAIAQREFELAASNLSVKELVALRNIDLKAKDLRLQQDKFEMDVAKLATKYAAELKSIAGDKTMNDDAKIDAVRRRLFGAIPEDSNG